MVYNLLRAVVLEPEQGAPRIRLLASAILRELAPSSSIVVRDFNPPVEESNIPCILPILLAQTNARERLSQMAPTIIRSNISLVLFPGCPQMVWEWYYFPFHVRKKLYLVFDVMVSSPVFFSSGLLSPPFLSVSPSSPPFPLLSPFSPPLSFPLLSPLFSPTLFLSLIFLNSLRWLTQPGYDEDLVLAALSFLHALCSHGRALERLVEDNFRTVSMQLSVWLRQANRSSLSSTSSSSGISLFGGSAKKQVG